MYKIPASTLFLGKNLVFMPECHSTNTLALQLCQKPDTPEGTLIITAHQTAGRGQRGNTWETEAGSNFTFSLVLKPTFLAVKDQFYLNIVVSLAIHDYLRHKGCNAVHIKWPNDMYVQGKKICGILIENQISGQALQNTVAGIGLNMNQQRFASPTATSLSLILNQLLDLPLELDTLLGFVEARYLQLRQGHYSQLRAQYLAALFQLHEYCRYRVGDDEVTGRIEGIDEFGRLQVRIDDAVRVFDVKEIGYVF